jgi:erythromycin esterase-like protein
MASNVALLHKTDTKVTIWAHDGHVTMDDDENPSWTVMGAHLRQQFGSLYYSVATIMGSGSILVRPAPGQPAIIMPINPESTSVATLFNSIGQSFFLNIRTLPAGPLVQWLYQPQTFTLAGGTVASGESMLDTQELARSFDGLVYLPVVSPTKPL